MQTEITQGELQRLFSMDIRNLEAMFPAIERQREGAHKRLRKATSFENLGTLFKEVRKMDMLFYLVPAILEMRKQGFTLPALLEDTS